jgi:hypothetical protein
VSTGDVIDDFNVINVINVNLLDDDDHGTRTLSDSP